jgi:hypothetical protein
LQITQKRVLVIILAFTGVYLKYASVSQQLIVPKLEVQVTQDGDNKLPVKVFDSNFLLLDCRLGRAPWRTRMVSGWRGYVQAPKKSGVFRDSAQNVLQTSAEMNVWKNILYTFTYT